MKEKILKAVLGSKQGAEAVVYRAKNSVPAYKKFLQQQNILDVKAFEELPVTDKGSYILSFPFEDLLFDDFGEISTIESSSGSSGSPFYWPTLKSHDLSAPTIVRSLLEDWFDISRKKTLAIVGMSLGSSFGGEYTSWAMKTMALQTSYPFWVFSPGNRHDEIIKFIQQMKSLVDQIIIFMVPSAIGHLHFRAKEKNENLPLSKIRYVVTGEPFPESFRVTLRRSAGIGELDPFMFSIYGSADTSSFGVESRSTVSLRRLLHQNPDLSKELGIDLPIPLFFHVTDPELYLERVNGQLCVTRWQAIPLVRYLLHDDVELMDWKELKKAIVTSETLKSEDKPLKRTLLSSSDYLPDILAVRGRADSALILNGSNLTESMIDDAVKCEELQELLTGLYRASIVFEKERQYLLFDLEIKQGVFSAKKEVDRIYTVLMKRLASVQPEFQEDWQNIYRIWDDDPSKRILKITLLPWPALSRTTETQIKQRGLV